jgi:transposase-like protein
MVWLLVLQRFNRSLGCERPIAKAHATRLGAPIMRPQGSAKVLEARRRRALSLLDQGRSLNEVGRKLGCAPSSVMRWRNIVQRHGPAGLAVRFSPGRRMGVVCRPDTSTEGAEVREPITLGRLTGLGIRPIVVTFDELSPNRAGG